jgi:hypothetical protein
MATMRAWVWFFIAASMRWLVAVLIVPANAQQPTTVNPTAQSVKEQV